MVQCLRPAWHLFRVHYPRIWWGGLLAFHLPILVGVLLSLSTGDVTGPRLLSAGSLVLASVFFALKLRDPRFLHFGSTQRSFLAWCLVIALAHSGAAARHDVSPAALETTAIVAVQVSLAIELLKRRRELLRRLTDLLRGWGTANLLPLPVALAERRQEGRLLRPVHARAFASRGPPRL